MLDDEDAKQVQNVNLIYHQRTDKTIFVVLTEEYKLYVIQGEDKTYVRRTIDNEKCAKTNHPFMQLVDGVQIGLKQVSPHFDNLFVEHYMSDEKKEEWVRQIVYFHDNKDEEGNTTSTEVIINKCITDENVA